MGETVAKKTICLDNQTKELYLDLSNEFNKLTRKEQTRFIKRNGFSFETDKAFFKTALMVCIAFASKDYSGDIVLDRGRYAIDRDNLKSGFFSKKVGFSFPRDWSRDLEFFKLL